MPLRVLENAARLTLVELVVLAVGPNRIAAAAIFLWHRLGWLANPVHGFTLEGRWGILMQPIDVLLAGVAASVPMLELFTEGHAELAEPHVVCQTLASPNGAGVTLVLDREIAVLVRI